MALFKILRGLSTNFALELNPAVYDSTKTYKVGDLCTYNSLIYKCTTRIDPPEAWNPNHWHQLSNSPAFTDGFAYFTPDDGGFYIDAQYIPEGEVSPVSRRIKVNSWHNVNLTGVATAPTVLNQDGTVNIDDDSLNIVNTHWISSLLTTIIDGTADSTVIIAEEEDSTDNHELGILNFAKDNTTLIL